jgi:L-rhamnose mutarotase
MQRLCFFIELEEGAEEEYERRHRELWPEMHDALVAAGYTNYSLFRRATTVVGYAECVPDVATVMAKMAEAEVTPRWNASFAPVIRQVTDEDGQLLTADEVWHL